MKSMIAAEFDKMLGNFRLMSQDVELTESLQQAVLLCCKVLDNGGKLMFAGNGGSAADAQHWAGELVGRFYYERPGLAAMALTTDASILTAVGNDYGYDHVFARQIEALGKAGDVFIAISTSGNSPNILRAAETARECGINLIGLTGQGGGKLAGLCDICFRVPSNETPRIQEGHEFIGHVLCALIEARMFPREND